MQVRSIKGISLKNAILLLVVVIYICGIGIVLRGNISIINNINIIILGICIAYILLINDKLLIAAQFATALFSKFVVDTFNLSGIIAYMPDAITTLIFLKIIYLFGKKVIKLNNKFIYMIFIMFVINISAYIINQYNIISFLWGVRDNYRFFVFFLACMYLNIDLSFLKTIIKILIFIAIIQVPILFLQKGLFPNNNDAINGTFGYQSTGLLLLYMLFALSIIFSGYVHKYFKMSILIIFVIAALTPALLGDLRATYLFIPILIIWIFLSRKKFTIKRLALISCILVVSISAILQINNIFNLSYIDKLEVLAMRNSANAYTYLYTSSYDLQNSLNRLSAPSYINKNLLNTFDKKLLGIGVGNGAPSKYEFVTSDFFKSYGYLKYYLFYFPYFFLENGYLGLGMLILFILSIYRNITSIETYYTDGFLRIICLAMKGYIVIILLSTFYNHGLLSESIGYLFWGMSGIILNNGVHNENKKCNI